MQRVSAKVILDTRKPLANGKFTAKLRVSYDYKQKYYSLQESFSKDEWEEIMAKGAKDQLQDKQLIFKSIEVKAINIIRSLHPFSLTAFEREFYQRTYKKSDMLLMMKDYQDELIKKGSKGTSECYKSSEHSIKAFLKAKKLPDPIFEDITPEWLTKYENWMLERGRSVSTVGIYMRNVRTMMNIARDKGLLNNDAYPFGKRKYVIPATRNIKKALSKEDIKNIYNYTPTRKQEDYAKDMWMFSYLCNGMNIKDIALLKNSSVIGNQIEFIRAKTANTKKQDSKPIRASINEPMKAIMHKWGKHSIDPQEYLFNILSKKDDTEAVFRKVKQATRNINKYMKMIGEKLGIEQPLTTYVARHSFATILKNSNISVQYISEALGHTSLQTTAIYLDSFEKEEIEKNQEKLLDF